MPAPTTLALDDFNALPDFLLTDREGWDTSTLLTGTLSLSTDDAPTSASPGSAPGLVIDSADTIYPDAYASNRWPMVGFVDQECWVTLAALGTVSLYTRLLAGQPANGYELQWLSSGEILLFTVVNDVETQIAAFLTTPQSVGASLALSSIGSVHAAWYRAPAADWVFCGETDDTTYAAAGDIGLGSTSSGSLVAIDEFGGGGTAGVDGSYTPRRGGSRR